MFFFRRRTEEHERDSQMLLTTLQELIEEKNKTDVILNHLDEGVLLLDEARVVQNEYSPFVETLFETTEISGRTIEDLVFPDEGMEERAELREFLDTVLSSPNADADFIDAINPIRQATVVLPRTKGAVRLKTMEFRFARTIAGRDSERLLVVIRDVSGQAELDKALEEGRKQAAAQLDALSGILRFGTSTFVHFFREAEAAFAAAEGLLSATPDGARIAPAGLDAALRQVHSAKGNAMTLGFASIAGRAHELEAVLVELKSQAVDFSVGMNALVAIANFQEEVSVHRQNLEQVLAKVLPGQAWEVASTPWEQSLAACGRLRQTLTPLRNPLVAGALDSLEESLFSGAGGDVFPLSEFLESHVRQIAGPRKIDWRLDSEVKALPPALIGPLRDCLLHLVRNAVDHGLESPEERRSVRKPEQGSLVLKIVRQDDGFELSVTDDGRGTDRDPEVLLAPGFSTRADSVTAVSGRGVGLDAVAATVRALGGRLRLDTSAGAGMSVVVWVPGPGARIFQEVTP